MRERLAPRRSSTVFSRLPRFAVLAPLLAVALSCSDGSSGPLSQFVISLQNHTFVPMVFVEVDAGLSFTVQVLDSREIARPAAEGATFSFFVHPEGEPERASETVTCTYHRERRSRSTTVARRVEWSGQGLQCSPW